MSFERPQVLDQDTNALQQAEDFSAATIRNSLSDLRQFMAWCEWGWREAQDERPFTLQAIASSLHTCYRTYLHTTRTLGYLITKYAQPAQMLDVSPHNLCHNFGYRMAEVVLCISWLKLWGMIRSIRQCSLFAARSKTRRRCGEDHMDILEIFCFSVHKNQKHPRSHITLK